MEKRTYLEAYDLANYYAGFYWGRYVEKGYKAFLRAHGDYTRQAEKFRGKIDQLLGMEDNEANDREE